MRTTVELPPAAHRRATELAKERHQSLASFLGELTLRGLADFGEPMKLTVSPVSGFPTLSLGQAVTSADVADALDDE